MEPIVKKWYDGLNEGKLLGLKCKRCGTVEFPPFPVCNTCSCTDLEWIEISGEGMMDSFAMQLEQSGIREEEYYARLGRKKEDFRKDMQMQAEINSRQQFLLEEVAAAEGLTVSDSEIEEEYRKIASRYDVSVKEVKERLGKKHDELIRKDLVCRKALELLVRCSEEIAFS